VTEDDTWTETLGFTDLGTKERKETIGEIKTLIRTLGERHPEVFENESVSPADYQREFKDAIFSLGGVLRQEHGADNEDTVSDVFLDPAKENDRLTYTDQRGQERIDFKGRLQETDETFALDVKGGEGQSIGHLLVPENADVLVVWSERNARNTKAPSSRLNEVINRTVRWGFNHSEDPTAMVIRDEPAGARTETGKVIPDLVVFPERFPTPDAPEPAMRDVSTFHFGEVLYETLVGDETLEWDERQKHIWFHELSLRPTDSGFVVEKHIYNAYDEDITLTTQSVDYDRISDIA
jgi:hypothetical protein